MYCHIVFMFMDTTVNEHVGIYSDKIHSGEANCAKQFQGEKKR